MSVEREIGGPDGRTLLSTTPSGPAPGPERLNGAAGPAPLGAAPLVAAPLGAARGARRPLSSTRPRAQSAAAVPSSRGPQVDGARILVVDDEEVVRMLVVDLLRERGHMVREAEDGDSAMVQLSSSDALDLMITDIGLPNDFDGSTLARRARVLRPGLPILFITGYAFGTRGITLEPGIPVLTKPFTLAALSDRIAALLDRPQA